MRNDRWAAICGGSRVLAWLTVMNVAVWIVVTMFGIAASVFHVSFSLEQWLSLPSSFHVFLTRPWTLLTYMVVQYNFLHLLFNVLWLYWFGIILVNILTDRYLVWLYVGGGLTGGVFFLLSSSLGWGGGWLCGSSAAVLAVMATAAIRLPDHKINLFLIGPVALKWIAIVCAVLTFLGGGGNQPAHVGGLLFGIVFPFLRISSLPDLSFLSRSAPKERKRKPDKIIDAFERRRQDMARLDEILDKIKISGYESLSRRERAELQDLSSRLKK